ncbi:MAG: hypothetical protein BJ554DRAFT_4876 [Olpidium bornovanus]|uniref:Retrotransposon gag domain-containing protein n=1 Tax=Olpidium bornovanus TaxID=278681 RepID=A0A8H7ZKF9_9FUNG|nr:MAG: hypothetical protein BJ554DRAFT_4876 [Olpidium bornovanus]
MFQQFLSAQQTQSQVHSSRQKSERITRNNQSPSDEEYADEVESVASSSATRARREIQREQREHLRAPRELHPRAFTTQDPDVDLQPTTQGAMPAAWQVKQLLADVPKYDGGGGADTLQMFISKFDTYDWNSHGLVTDAMKLDLAVQKLQCQAHELWLAHEAKHLIGSLERWTTWPQLREALRKCFLPSNYLRELREKLTKIHFSKFNSVSAYIDAFNTIYMQLPDLCKTDSWLLTQFTVGLVVFVFILVFSFWLLWVVVVVV